MKKVLIILGEVCALFAIQFLVAVLPAYATDFQTFQGFRADCMTGGANNCEPYSQSKNTPATSTVVNAPQWAGEYVQSIISPCADTSENNHATPPNVGMYVWNAANGNLVASTTGGGWCSTVPWTFPAPFALPSSFYFTYTVHDGFYQAGTDIVWNNLTFVSAAPTSPDSLSGAIGIAEPANLTTFGERDFFTVNYRADASGLYYIYVLSATSSNDLNFVSTKSRKSVWNGYANASTTYTELVYRTDVECHSENECEAPTGTTWYARAYLYSEAGVLAATSTVNEFNVLYTFVNVPFGTTTPTSTNYFFIEHVCPEWASLFASTTLENISCNVANFFRRTANDVFKGAEDKMFAVIGLIQKAFPLNVFKHIQDDITNAPRGQFADVDMTFPNGFRASFVTTSTPEWIIAKIRFDYRTFLDYLMYVVTGGIMITGAVVVAKTII